MEQIGREFSYETFASGNKDSNPDSLLPQNLDSFWIDEILNARLSCDKSAISIINSIINFACTVLVAETGKEMEQIYPDIYLQELLLEKLARINKKAAITNSAFDYIPAETDNIFTGPHYSPEHMATLMKLVAGAIEWEKRWSGHSIEAA